MEAEKIVETNLSALKKTGECELCALCKKPIPVTAGGAAICLNCAVRKVATIKWLESYCEEYCHIDHEGDKMVWADAMLKQAKIQAEAKNDE
ncbi:MAG: hypothetical protein AAB649_00780 [Patescibacteria group bacterium]